MDKSNAYRFLVLLFIICSSLEIIAEYYQNQVLLLCVKPTLMPLLFGIYYARIKSIDFIYFFALFFNWIANILFLSKSIDLLTFGSVVFFISRILIVYKVYKEIKLPSVFPFVLGTIPFLFLFIYLNFLIVNDISSQTFMITISQSVVVSIMGGISLGNYIMKNDKSSILLLLSSVFYALNIVFLGIKFYYLDLYYLKSFAMIFFVLSHFALLQFMIMINKAKIGVDH